MGEIKTSKGMLDLANEAVQAGKPFRQTDTFEAFYLPKKNGFLSRYVLLLFTEGNDFPKGKIPLGIIIPVKVDNRQGYLLHEKHVSNYQP